MANVPERRVVVYACIDEAPLDETAASRAARSEAGKRGEETRERKPSLADFGWDFPFNPPRPAR